MFVVISWVIRKEKNDTYNNLFGVVELEVEWIKSDPYYKVYFLPSELFPQ